MQSRFYQVFQVSISTVWRVDPADCENVDQIKSCNFFLALRKLCSLQIRIQQDLKTGVSIQLRLGKNTKICKLMGTPTQIFFSRLLHLINLSYRKCHLHFAEYAIFTTGTEPSSCSNGSTSLQSGLWEYGTHSDSSEQSSVVSLILQFFQFEDR